MTANGMVCCPCIDKGRKPYQKFRKLAAISNSVISSDLLAPLACPEPSLEMDKLTAEVPLRCIAGREDLVLEAMAWEEEGERR